MNRLTDNGLRAALGLALLLAGTGAANAATYSAELTATPASYSGECPATITFKGVIKTDKPGNVQYKFVRSDGAFAPIQTINFAAPGAKEVTSTWKLGGAGLPSYSGWQAIEIVYPTSLQSNKANFSISCKISLSPATAVQGTVPVVVRKPEITGYQLPGKCATKGREVAILGKHFGNQAGKRVALGGHGIHVDLAVRTWTDTRIDATLPDDARIVDGRWYYIGIEKADHTAWLSNINKTVTVCQAPKPEITGYEFSGKCVAKGSELTIRGRNFGSNVDKGVALGGHGLHVDLALISWSNTRIVARVPNDTRIVAGRSYYTGVEKANHSGWLSNINKSIKMCAPVVLSPAAAISAAVAAIEPVITGYRHPGTCVAKGSDFTIVGRHFGERNGKHVRLGGHGFNLELPVRSWGDTQIVVGLPNHPGIANGQWYYTGIRNAANNRWLSNISENFMVCR